MAGPRKQTTHGRFYQINGDDYASVTTILGAINKPALVQWAAKEERTMTIQSAADLYEDIHGTPKMSRATYVTTLDARLGKVKAHQKLLSKAAEIGTQVHALIEWNIRRSLQQKVGPEPKIEDKASWAFMAYQDWAKAVDMKPLLIEQTVYSHAHKYAGTMDLLAEVEGQVTLVDFKTGKAVYGEAHLQNVAYQMALKEMGHLAAERGMILRLPKVETDPNFEAVTIPPAEELFPTFLAVQQVWQWWYAEEKASRARWEAQRAGLKAANAVLDREIAEIGQRAQQSMSEATPDSLLALVDELRVKNMEKIHQEASVAEEA